MAGRPAAARRCSCGTWPRSGRSPTRTICIRSWSSTPGWLTCGSARSAAAGGLTMSPDITLADAITALVAEKRAVGYKYAGEERVLARFAAFCRSQFPGLGAPSQASVEAWLAAARRREVQPATLQTLAAPVRELARWLG